MQSWHLEYQPARHFGRNADIGRCRQKRKQLASGTSWPSRVILPHTRQGLFPGLRRPCVGKEGAAFAVSVGGVLKRAGSRHTPRNPRQCDIVRLELSRPAASATGYPASRWKTPVTARSSPPPCLPRAGTDGSSAEARWLLAPPTLA